MKEKQICGLCGHETPCPHSRLDGVLDKVMPMKEKILEDIKQAIYHRTLLRSEVISVMDEAENDIEKDGCVHSFVEEDNGGYYWGECSKCGKLKQ